MAYNPSNPNGITTSAYSTPVVIASDQAPVASIPTSSQTAFNAGIKGTYTAYGYTRVTAEPKYEFVDAFDSVSIDTVNNWFQSGTVTQANSQLFVGNITTTNTINSLTSQPKFGPVGLSFQVLAFTGGFESNPLSTTNVNRFYGFGQHSGTPSISLPITDGCGFEWDSINSILWLSVYQGGVRSASSVNLSAYVTSANTRYAILYRSDLVIAYISSTEIPVGSVSFVSPFTQILPIKIQTVIGSSTPSTTPLNYLTAVTVADTGGNTTQLADGTYPYRKAKIDTAGNLNTNISASVLPTGALRDDTVVLLSRILKILEPVSVADVAQRQRITIDNISGGLTLGTITTVSTVTTVSAVTSITNALPTGTNTLGNVNVGGMDREMYINIAKQAYNTGIRTRLN